jgi:hypothetical protein
MAARFWVNGGNGNINSTTNWSDTSGGTSGASVPTSVDDVTFDANGNSNATINGTATWLSLTITSGYTATMTHNAVLTVAGDVTFGANYTIAGSSSMTISATSTITSNGKTWSNAITFSGVNTKTLVGDFTIGGLLTISANTTLNATTSETLIATNGIINTQSITGTATIKITGGTISSSTLNRAYSNNLIINGNVTIGTLLYVVSNTITFDNTGGPYTVTTTGSTLHFANITMDTDGITWGTIQSNNTTNSLVINSLLTANTINLNSDSVNFSGTHGFEVNNLINPNITIRTTTLKEGLTYRVNQLFESFLTSFNANTLFISSDPTNRAFLILQNGAICRCRCNFTRIDASGGRPIRSFNGNIVNCVNIVSINDLQTVASAA